MSILINPARFRLGADTAIGRLLGDEPAGLAIDFLTGQALVRGDKPPEPAPELIVNGTFNTDFSSWTAGATAGTTTLSVVSGALRITTSAGNTNGWATQPVTTVVGKTYKITATYIPGTSVTGRIRAGTTAGGSELLNATAVAGRNVFVFEATTTTTHVNVAHTTASQYLSFDDISMTLAGGNFMGDVNDLLAYTGSPKRVYDAAGLLGYGSHNLLLWSQDFTNAVWDPWTVTRAADTIVAPDGTMTADSIIADATSGGHQLEVTVAGAAVIGAPYTFSGYFKPKGWNFVRLTIYDAVQYNGYVFNIQTGEVALTVNSPLSYKITPLPGGWFRVSVTRVVDAAALYVNMVISPTSDVLVGTGDGTSGVYAWGCQLERNASPSNYLSTTTAARYGIPLDHDPITHAPQGVWMEDSKTNKILRSQEFGTTWVPLNVSVTSNVALSPEGTTTGDRLTATSNTTPGISQVVTGVANATAFSVFAKAGTASWLRMTMTLNGVATDRSAWFDLANGVVGSKESSVVYSAIQPAGNGWFRCSMHLNQTAVAETHTIRMVTGNLAVDGVNGQTIDLWGAQLEIIALYASSYIPTTTAAVVRLVDTLTLSTLMFPDNPPEWTIICEYNSLIPTHHNTSGTIWYMYASATDSVHMFRSATVNRLQVTTRTANVVTMNKIYVNGGNPPFVVHRSAYATDNTPSASHSFDGGSTNVETAPGAIPLNLNSLILSSSAVNTNSLLRKIVYLPRRAADSELPRMSYMPPSMMLLPAPPEIFDGDLRDRLPRPEPQSTPAKRKRKT